MLSDNGKSIYENEEAIRREAIMKEALRKNNEELDKMCKSICLFFGWLLVIMILVYVIYMINIY
jgi:hypothetical protein